MMPMRVRHLWVVAVLAVFLGSCGRKSGGALSPEEALKSFHLSDDFHVEIFATEPHVVDPVEMAFDENGRAYVADMLDYPEDPPAGKPARSRIMLLEDRDGDGRVDHSTVFADHVLEVSGLMCWKGGLIVTSAPDILFLKDTDGDGKADVRQVLYTGFPTVNPEGRITNPRLASDNWIYCANNGADGKITQPDHPERPPILVRGNDFRFHPLRGVAEPSSGPAQYGLTIDDFGNRFITHNTVHLRQVMVPYQYLVRAPLLETGPLAQDISDHGRPSAAMYPLTGPQEWRVKRTALRQQRYNEVAPGRVEQVAGYFTAAAGSTIYSGDVFPPEYWGNVFTGDVSGNLVHRDVLKPDGVLFAASRAKDKIEFLASTDQWFRPCNFANAPDGTLYMIDIYRQFIETPESIPEEIKKTMDFWAGDKQGRIYRIVPNHPLRKRDLKPNLGAATAEQLARDLENTNGWYRETAQRLLIERQDKTAVPALEALARNSAMPQARVRALWTLESFSALKPELVISALKDPDARVREQALRLAEEFASTAAVTRAALALKSDPDVRVQYQLAFSLGVLRDARSLESLADIAAAHAADPWFRTAVLSSAHNDTGRFLPLVMARKQAWGNAAFVRQLGALIGAKHTPAEVSKFLAALSTQAEAGLAGLAHGFKVANVSGLSVAGAEAALGRFTNSASDPVQNAAWDVGRYLELGGLLARASAQASNNSLPPGRRAAAIRALRGGRYATVAPVLKQVLAAHPPQEVEAAAIDSLAAFNDPGVPETLLGGWKAFGPEARRHVIAAMLGRRDRVPVLLKSIEERRIESSAVEVAARARLMESSDPSIAERAHKLFQGGDRQKAVDAYRPVLSMKGNVEHGKKVFEETCGKCHMPRKQGGRVGPDLSGINNKTKEELLTSILNPSYAIEPRYVNYTVTTKDGSMYDGVLAGETPGAITLRGGAEDDVTILRVNIAEIRASSISLMPDDLEESLSRQDLADVIAYLRGGL